MKHSAIWPRVLLILGIGAMLVGAIDPLEGSLLILPGAGVAALGAFLGGSRWRRLLGWAFALVAVGVAAMFVLSWLGGVGGKSGRSMYWLAVVAPYPVGWMLGLVGAVLALVESFRRDRPPLRTN